MNLLMDRRQLIALSLLSIAGSSTARAQAEPVVRDEHGEIIEIFRLPVEISTDFMRTPGALAVGGERPDVILVEFFDYNCSYCKKAAGDLDALVRQDPDLGLVLLHNAILSPGSVEAAKFALAVYSLKGREAAYRFHQKLLLSRGAMNGERALQAARDLGFDAQAVSNLAQDPRIAATLARHMELAASAGFSATPAFSLKGYGLIGYPGPEAIKSMTRAVRACDRLEC